MQSLGGVKVRLATESDYGSVLLLMKQLNPNDPQIAESLGREIFTSILNNDCLSVYLADIERKAVAACYLNVIPNLTRAGRPYALIENVVTDPSLRRSGIGTLLLRRVVAKAFDLDCYKVMLLTGRDSNVHTFYESCGFEKMSKTAFIIRDDNRD